MKIPSIIFTNSLCFLLANEASGTEEHAKRIPNDISNNYSRHYSTHTTDTPKSPKTDLQSSEWKKNLELISKTLLNKDVNGQETLASMTSKYKHGIISEERLKKYQSTIEKATKNNNSSEQYIISTWYSIVQPSDDDLKTEIKWLALSAHGGFVPAMSRLAILLEKKPKIFSSTGVDLNSLKAELLKLSKEHLGEYSGML